MDAISLLADAVPPTEFVVKWVVLPLVGVLALIVLIVVAVVRRQRRKARQITEA